jgi:glucose/arabinose dehydrogenase
MISFARIEPRFVAMMRLLLIVALLLVEPSYSVPRGFVDEGIADLIAITGAFAPNPRNGGKPMLLLSSKEGQVFVMEDPDNSDESFVVADLESRLCANGERGLQTIRPHPDFKDNRFIYMFYSRKRDGCLEDATLGPRNRLVRFKMDKDTLKIDLDSEFILLETPPTPKRVHNGGNIAFGNDGMIYVTTGDGGSRSPAVSQDPSHLHGSILRLRDDGTVPNDNPFAADGVRCGQSGGKTSNGICSEM